MSGQRSCIGYPWILDAIAKYKGGIFTPKAAPAQVVEFLKMPERSKECPYSGAIVHISDRKYYIRAIITKEAHETMEREDEHFALANIKNKIIILKKFTLSFAAEEDIRRCEFVLTIQHFSVLPMETDTVDLLNCNVEPNVWKRIKELWQSYMTELQLKETMSDLNSSDASLTQLIMVANEEKLGSLKSLAEQCLDLDQYATQDISPQARTMWSMEMRNNKNHSASFSVPINLLIICPEEEAALEQMSEFRTNNDTAGDADDSSGEENASTQYSTAASTFSQESMEDAYNSLSENPWNNLLSPCATGSTGSAVLDSSMSVNQGSCEKDIGVDSDPTPELYKDYQDKSMIDSSESQDQSPSLLSPGLRPNGIVPESEASTSTHFGPPSNHMKLADSSPPSTSLIPHAPDYPKDSLSQVYRSPQKTLSVGSKVPISPLLSHDSESDNDLSSGGTVRRKSSISRMRKAVKRKQTPEDLDTTLSDQEPRIPVCVEKADCVADVSLFERIISVANNSNGTQTKITSHIDKGGRTTQSCLKKEPERRQVVKRIGPETVKATGMSPARKKVAPYKPMLDFVAQPTLTVSKNSENVLPAANTHTSNAPCKEASPRVFCEQTSTFQGPVLENKKMKLTHFDGTSFQYKYKNPSADLRARVNALRIPTELFKWAKKIISDAKGKVP